MRQMWRAVIAVSLVACAVGGCSGGADDASEAPATSQAPTSTAAPPESSPTTAAPEPTETAAAPDTFSITTEEGYTADLSIAFDISVSVDPQDAPPGETDVLVQTTGTMTLTNTTPERNFPFEAFGSTPTIFLIVPSGPLCERRMILTPSTCAFAAGEFQATVDYRDRNGQGPGPDETWTVVLRPEFGASLDPFAEGSTVKVRVPEGDAANVQASLEDLDFGLGWYGVAGPLDVECTSVPQSAEEHFVWTASGASPC